MNASPCPRRWEAEAVEDKRLDAAGRASFERHTALCTECAREVALLGKIRGVGGSLPIAGWNAIDEKRLRAALLRRANEHMVRPPTRALPTLRWAFVIAPVVAAGLALAMLAPSRRSEGKPARVGGPTLEIATRRASTSPDIVSQDTRGTVPGADEDGGMAASRPANGTTERQTPRARRRIASAPASRRAAPAASIDSADPNEQPPPPPSVAATEVAAGALFAQAMGAFESGSYDAADTLFARFGRSFPADTRAEDASFLRVMCALRRGDRRAVEQGARAYLRAYPSGLRRDEVKRLLP